MLEEQERLREDQEEKEQRKQERAAKRAARKLAAVAQASSGELESSTLTPKPRSSAR